MHTRTTVGLHDSYLYLYTVLVVSWHKHRLFTVLEYYLYQVCYCTRSTCTRYQVHLVLEQVQYSSTVTGACSTCTPASTGVQYIHACMICHTSRSLAADAFYHVEESNQHLRTGGTHRYICVVYLKTVFGVLHCIVQYSAEASTVL